MTLAAELNKLYRAGAVTLPQAADEYAGAGISTHETGEQDWDGWGRTVITSGDPKTPTWQDDRMTTDFQMGKLQPQFTELRNTLQLRIIWQTHHNLVNAGQSLCRIAEDYAAQDGSTKTALDAEKEKIADQIPDVRKAPEPSDPHPKK